MFQLYKLIKGSNNLNGRYAAPVISELIFKITFKINELNKMAKNKQNVLKSPGFNQYIQTPNWTNISSVISQYN